MMFVYSLYFNPSFCTVLPPITIEGIFFCPQKHNNTRFFNDKDEEVLLSHCIIQNIGL